MFAYSIHWILVPWLVAAPGPVRSVPEPIEGATAEHDEDRERDHAHDVHEDDPQLHEGAVRNVVVEVPTDGPVRPQAAASDMRIGVGELRWVPRTSAEDLLTLAPGVSLTNAGGEGHPSTMYVRGFEASDGKDIEFSVEGVPLNEVSNAHGHGFTDTNFLIPELVSSLRFTQGTFDARQGDFALAGSAGYSLGMAERGVHTRAEYGSFNRTRMLLLWGPERQESGTFIGVDGGGGTGYGENRAYVAGRTVAGYARTFPDHVHLRLLGTAYNTTFQQGGVVRLDDFKARRLPCADDADSQFFCTYDRNQGGRFARYAVSGRVFRHDDARVYSLGAFVVGRTLLVRENFTGFTTDLDNPAGARGDGLEQDYEVITSGARSSYGLRWDWWGRQQAFDLGLDLRWDAGSTTLQRIARADGSAYDTLFDNRFHVVNPAPYVAVGIAALRWLDVSAGIRFDTWFYDVDPRSAASGNATGHAFAAQPRASLTVKPLRWLEWTNAYGIGSRSPDANGIGTGGRQDPARAQSAETGLRFHADEVAGLLHLDARVAGFYTHVDRDVVFDEDTGRNRVVGESNRYGVLTTARFGVADWVDFQASVTWSEAYLPPPGAGPFDWNAGERLPYIPRLTIRGDGTLWHGFHVAAEHFAWHTGLGIGHIGPRPLPSGSVGNAFTVVDAAGSLRWRWVELGVKIQNLLNARYREVELEYASNFAAPAAADPQLPMLHFSPGPPLTAMGVLTLHFEPGELAHFQHDRARARGRRPPGDRNQ